MKMPVLNPLLFTSATLEDALLLTDRVSIRKNGMIALSRVCQNVRDSPKPPEELFLVAVNNYTQPKHRFEEYYATRYQVRHHIQPLLNSGYKCITIAGASFVGNNNKIKLNTHFISGSQANICGFIPDLMVVLENEEERLIYIYLYNG